MAKYTKRVGDVSVEIEGTTEEVIQILKYEDSLINEEENNETQRIIQEMKELRSE